MTATHDDPEKRLRTALAKRAGRAPEPSESAPTHLAPRHGSGRHNRRRAVTAIAAVAAIAAAVAVPLLLDRDASRRVTVHPAAPTPPREPLSPGWPFALSTGWTPLGHTGNHIPGIVDGSRTDQVHEAIFVRDGNHPGLVVVLQNIFAPARSAAPAGSPTITVDHGQESYTGTVSLAASSLYNPGPSSVVVATGVDEATLREVVGLLPEGQAEDLRNTGVPSGFARHDLTHPNVSLTFRSNDACVALTTSMDTAAGYFDVAREGFDGRVVRTADGAPGFIIARDTYESPMVAIAANHTLIFAQLIGCPGQDQTTPSTSPQLLDQFVSSLSFVTRSAYMTALPATAVTDARRSAFLAGITKDVPVPPQFATRTAFAESLATDFEDSLPDRYPTALVTDLSCAWRAGVLAAAPPLPAEQVDAAIAGVQKFAKEHGVLMMADFGADSTIEFIIHLPVSTDPSESGPCPK